MLLAAALLPSCVGCAAFRNDLDGVPARYLPLEYRVASERGKRPIDPSLLGQTPPPEYLVDAGDVLAVYVEGVIGRTPELPPVAAASNVFERPTTGYPLTVRDDGTLALPYEGSVDVRGLSLRGVERKLREFYTYQQPLLREGRSRVLVGLHRPRTHRVLVVRQESGNRQGNIGSGGTVNFEIDKRGTGRVVELPAYRNDVLNAITETGGLPGVDARNMVYVIRRPRVRVPAPPEPPHRQSVPERLREESWSPVPQSSAELQPTIQWTPLTSHPGSGSNSPLSTAVASLAPPGELVPDPFTPPPASSLFPVVRGQSPDAEPYDRRIVTADYHQPFGTHANRVVPVNGCGEAQLSNTRPAGLAPSDVPYVLDDATVASDRVLKIPLRLHPGQPVGFRPEDVILHDGDVVFIESRQMEFFYTAGLLGGGQYPIPRDFDLNVLEALALVDRLGSGRNLLDRQISGPAATGLDVSTSASELIVLRTLPDGREVAIKVDLYTAMTDPAERLLVAPGDYLFLKYTKSEAVGAWIERWLFDNVANGVNNSTFVTGGRN
jgi:hypothetical protein